MTPFARLTEMAQRCQMKASQLPQQKELAVYWRGIGFMLAGQTFAADMTSVEEILQPPKMTKVPGVRSWMLGVANVRGRLVPVVDLAGMLNVPSKSNWRNRRVLVLEHGDHMTGLLVDAVLGMQQFAEDRRVTQQRDIDQTYQAFVEFGYERDDKYWPIFDLSKLVQAPEFMQIAV